MPFFNISKILWIFLTLLPTALWAASPVVGKWKTIDDETGKPRSVVEITQDGDIFKGHVSEIINPDKPNPTCEKCSGDKKDKPIVGLEIIWDMKETKKDAEWSKGQILDPKNGKSYNCILKIKEDGQKLEVRGFVGLSLFGRSQTWLKDTPTATP